MLLVKPAFFIIIIVRYKGGGVYIQDKRYYT